MFLKQTDAHLTLYLRNAKRLRLSGHEDRVCIVEGDVLDSNTLDAAMVGREVVYANLAGQLEEQSRSIVKAMDKAGVTRLIYHQFDGDLQRGSRENHGSVLDPYRNGASDIEASNLDYTILRPA